MGLAKISVDRTSNYEAHAMLSIQIFTLCALGVRDAYLTGLKSRSCQHLDALPGAGMATSYVEVGEVGVLCLIPFDPA